MCVVRLVAYREKVREGRGTKSMPPVLVWGVVERGRYQSGER